MRFVSDHVLSCHRGINWITEHQTVATARSSGTAIRVHRLRPATPTARPAHTSDPAGLLALAQTAFGRSPEAWWITIPATDFSFGAPLSALAERGMADALATLWRLLAPSDAAPAGLGCAANEAAACPEREPS